MSEKQKNALREEKKKRWRHYVAAVLLVCLLGVAVELLCGLPSLNGRRQNGGQPADIAMESVTYDGFHERDGKLYFDGQQGTIRIMLGGRYVDKLSYTYEYDNLLDVTARIGVYNEYGELRERDAVTVEDKNSKVLDRSYLRIGARAEYAELTVSRDGLFEPGLSYLDYDYESLAFTGFELVSDPVVNPYRLLFFWCAFGAAAFLYLGRELMGRRIEVGFLVISLSAGVLMSWSLPANKVSWDEEVHFEQSFWLANYRSPVPVSPAVMQEFSAGVDTWPYHQPDTIEEQEALDRYLDTTGDYRNGDHLWSTDLNKATLTGYAGTALFLKAGQLLHMPFSLLFKFGRLGNLLVYSLVMYFAIKKTPVGKGIMAFLALMPEPVMLAGVYSYDPTVTAFLYLSMAYVLWGILEPEGTIGWKEYAVMLLAFFWGCRIKAVYAPLLLIGLLIPAARYRSRQEKLLMRSGFVAAAVVLMISFILPVLLAPSATGDVRGEATSEVGQMAYVLGQPLTYAVILVKNILATLPSYVLGEGSLGLMGHQGAVPFGWLLYAAGGAVILTNGQSSCGKRLDGKQKLWIFAIGAVVVAFVWTSMYIAFTTPGNTYIDGVQGRYYLPFLFLIWLLMNPRCVTVHLDNARYYTLVLGAGAAMLLAAYYTNVLQMFCL